MRKNGKTTKCAWCGKEIYRIESRLKKHNYCCASCQMRYRYAHGLDGKKITQKAHEVLRTKGHYKRNNNYLYKRNPAKKPEVKEKIRLSKLGVPVPKLQGKNNPNWKGGVDKGIWHTKEYHQWRMLVFKRDNFTCQECGDNKGGNLEAHHIKPRYLYPELIFNVSNGRTLCDKCHKKTSTYGNRVKLLPVIE